MISWLKGQKVENWKNGNREGIVIACSGVGYEVQLLPKQLSPLNHIPDVILWIHQVSREEGDTLFGFINREERDLFRHIIGVNGVGPQMGISLLQIFNPEEFVQAVISKDILKLSSANGIGKKTAERLFIELKNKFTEENCKRVTTNPIQIKSLHVSDYKKDPLDEIRQTLKTLGYENNEIQAAIEYVKLNSPKDSARTPVNANGLDSLLEDALRWLSQEVA